MISTTADLAVFFSTLLGGRILPARLLDEMTTPEPLAGYGLGVFVQDLVPEAGTIIHHNGGAPGGFGALMIGSPDGIKVLTAGITMGDEDMDPAQAFPAALGALVASAFGTPVA
ncbi:hypothetical protein GCM10009750_01030 [Agromyces salentinus]|uniref:Beta-lactamase-related domain-containing protein n=1 Tax=Agromyces salentinus TaxID=269421 RepID=A0ABN2MEX6_9MICO